MIKQLTVAHTADWHLEDVTLQEAGRCVIDFCGEVEHSQPTLVAITGDIFESENVRLDSQAAKFAMAIVERLANVCPVIILKGTDSHEGKAMEVFDKIKANFSIYVSMYPEMIGFLSGIEEDGNFFRLESDDPANFDALISTLPPPSKQFFPAAAEVSVGEVEETIGQQMGLLFADFGRRAQAIPVTPTPHIILGHFNVRGASISDTQVLIGRDIEVSRDSIELANATLVCLGHIHKAQQIGSNIFFCGSTYSKTWGELDPKGFYLHTIEGDGAPALTESLFINTSSVPRVIIRESFCVEPGEQPKSPEIPATAAGARVRYIAKVYQGDKGLIDRPGLRELIMAAGAADAEVSVVEIPRVSIRSERVIRANTLPEKVAEYAASRGETVTEDILAMAADLEAMRTEDFIDSVLAMVEPAKEERRAAA